MSIIVAWGKLYTNEMLTGIIYHELRIKEDKAVLLDIVKKPWYIWQNESHALYQISNNIIMHSKIKLQNLDGCEFKLRIIRYLINNKFYNVASFYWKYVACTLVSAYRELKLDDICCYRLRKPLCRYKSVVYKLLIISEILSLNV